MYLRWDKKGRLVREGHYNSGKQVKLWKYWIYEEKEVDDYAESFYGTSGKLLYISSYWIRNQKKSLRTKTEYIVKGDTTIRKITDWYIDRPGQIKHINKLVKVNKKFLLQETKSWLEEGWLLREILYTEEGKNTIVCKKDIQLCTTQMPAHPPLHTKTYTYIYVYT